MSEQTNCPDCGRPFAGRDVVGCFGKRSTACRNRTITRLRSELGSAQAATREALKVCRESGVRIGQLEGEAIFLRSELELARAVCEAAEHLRTELVGHETDDALLDAMVSCDAALAAYRAHKGGDRG